VTALNPNYFIHAANILLLFAYCVRDILWLRIFALVSSLIAIPYFVHQPIPMWEPIAWSSCFAAINLFQSWRLLIERRPVKLTAEEEMVRQLAFRELSPRKTLQILSLGRWRDVPAGEILIERGNRPDAILLMLRGKVLVKRYQDVLGELGPGSLVGSALLLNGLTPEIDVVVLEPVRGMSWEINIIDRYLMANPETRVLVQRFLAHDLAGKVESLSKPSVGTAS
jgi:CRP-like cAMP-binding protein